MAINWEVILWTCVTLAVIIGIGGLILSFLSAKNVRKRRTDLEEIHTELRIGSQILFGGGIYGRVVGIEADTVNVEIAKGTVIKVSRYAIQSFVSS